MPTAFEVCDMAGQLTSVVGPTNVVTNGFYATEYQCLALGHGSSNAAWAAAVAGYPSNALVHTNHFYDNVGWLRGTKSENGKWGSYLWTLENRIVFKSSATNRWTSLSNGVWVVITNVLVGSLGDYGPMEDVVDVGPHLDAATNNFPGANTGEDRSFAVDITNVYYRLVIPGIWITPRVAYAAVGGSNVEFNVTGTNIPLGVTWTIIPTNFTGHADFDMSTNFSASVTPGTVATNYKVRATSKDNT
ncbi:MAG: hypothetical protein L6455_02290, partial [Kiritimatiellae bacterium]|nr:hypothetical protein [Kiritimatiellia bacterium]